MEGGRGRVGNQVQEVVVEGGLRRGEGAQQQRVMRQTWAQHAQQFQHVVVGRIGWARWGEWVGWGRGGGSWREGVGAVGIGASLPPHLPAPHTHSAHPLPLPLYTHACSVFLGSCARTSALRRRSRWGAMASRSTSAHLGVVCVWGGGREVWGERARCVCISRFRVRSAALFPHSLLSLPHHLCAVATCTGDALVYPPAWMGMENWA